MKDVGRRGELAVAVTAFGLALAARAVFLFSPHQNYDFTSWRIVAGILERGGNVYRETSRYNYSPLWSLILLGLERLAGIAGLTFERAISLFLLAVDVGIAALIRSIALRRGWIASRAWLASALFFANPVSVIVSSYLGTFDNFSILFLLLALFWLESQPARQNGGAAFLALSLLAKHITWFHPLLFARRRAGPRLSWIAALSPYAVFAASFLPYLAAWRGVKTNVFSYRGLDEPYGTEFLRSVAWLPQQTTTVLFVAAALTAVALLGRVEIGRACLLLFLVLLIFTPGVCAYYFIWPIALGALYPSIGYLVYSAVVGAFFIHSPDVLGVELPHLPGWGGVWWAIVFWLLWEIRSVTQFPAGAVADRRLPR